MVYSNHKNNFNNAFYTINVNYCYHSNFHCFCYLVKAKPNKSCRRYDDVIIITFNKVLPTSKSALVIGVFYAFLMDTCHGIVTKIHLDSNFIHP